jgi:hypothetical protein
MLERLEGIQLREQHLLRELRTLAAASCVFFEPERFEPAALAEHLLQREELELRRLVPAGEKLWVRYFFELLLPGGE